MCWLMLSKNWYMAVTVQNESSAMLSNVRHITLMEQAKSQIEQSLNNIESGLPVDFIRY